MSGAEGLLTVAIDAARRAGTIIIEGADRPLDVQFKGDDGNDPVTNIDRRSETAIAERVRESYPTHRILSEEGTTGGDDPDWRWIIDPLDGTTNYAHHVPFYAVSIAVEHDGEIVAGVVLDVSHDDLFIALRGDGATLNGLPIHVSEIETARRALLSSGFGLWEASGRRFDRTRAFSGEVQAVRDLGSAAIEMCLVACGRLDGMGGSTLNAWDVAAGTLIVREAGGQVTGPHGEPFHVDDKHLVVSNGRLHEAILARLQQESAPLESAPPPQDGADRP